MSLKIKTPSLPLLFNLSNFVPEHDAELAWLCEEAELTIGTRSNWGAMVDAALDGGNIRSASTLEEEEQRVDAMHRASTIIGWLESLAPPHSDVLVAAYRPPPRPWPVHYALKLGRLAGVVAMLRSVRDGYERARAGGRTVAPTAADWLDEQLVRGDDGRANAARLEAFGLYARALAAYRKARGSRPSLAPEES